MSVLGYQSWHGEPPYGREVAKNIPFAGWVVDLGGGTGWLANHIPPGCTYVLLEAPRELHVAPARGHPVIATLDEKLPFRACSVDTVILKDVLEHLTQPLIVIREAHRILNPSGHMYVSAPVPNSRVWDDYTHVRPFTRRGLLRLLSDGGFAPIRVWNESTAPGVGVWARRFGGSRPRIAHCIAGFGIGPSNTVVVARKGAVR